MDPRKKLADVLKRFPMSGLVLALFTLYFLVSILLSVAIYMRLQDTPTMCIKCCNVVLYYTNYTILPSVAIGVSFLVFLLFLQKQQQKSSADLFWAYILMLMFYFLVVLISFTVCKVPEYAYQWLPLLMLFMWYRPQSRITYKKSLLAFAAIFLIGILIPHITAFECFNCIASKVPAFSNKTETVEFVAGYIRDTTTFSSDNNLRANNDLWKFLLVGVGQCGEVAMATTAYLNTFNIQTRKASFPGEDHVFVEAKLNGTWWVVDPGYYGSKLLSRSERAADRVRETGTISYVAAYEEHSFTELTPYYVGTDTVIIRITDDGEALTDVSVLLVHTLRYDSSVYDVQLPGQGYAFHTDTDGRVTIHLGKLAYTAPFEKTDLYYWIYVNGQNTRHNVTSTGSGQTQLVEIDLSRKD
jgi:hypothetical protein